MSDDKPETVDAYLEALSPERRDALLALRDLVRRTIPKAEESMRQGMPTYVRGEKPVVSMASQKHYMALYVCEADALLGHQDELLHLNVGKSCIRFRRLQQLPLPVIEKIVREADLRAQGRLTSTRRRPRGSGRSG
jgi:uncharacterized protein YdhG (YjbR/CyaY superfamily)